VKEIVCRIRYEISKAYFRYYTTISLNKNLIFSGFMGLLFSAIISHVMSTYPIDPVANSALTVATGFIVYKTIFAILFHIDNKPNLKKKHSTTYNLRLLRHVWVRIIIVSSIFDTINNATRFILMTQMLSSDYSAIQSTVSSSIIASLISYTTINFMVKYIHLFALKR
jgi:hypothetical protein